MAEEAVIKNTGLRGVTVADTKISYIDGEKGVLIYRGYRIEDIVANSTFEETAYLLIKGELPTASELNEFKNKIARAASPPEYLIHSMKLWPKDATPMRVLSAALSIAAYDDRIDDVSLDAYEDKAAALISAMAAAMVVWERIRNNREPVPYSEEMTHAENILHMISGKKPDPEVARVLDICLILHADHTFNASTFACREVASTQADIYAGALAGLAALSGPLHGGANEKAMNMMDELKNESDIESWIRNKLSNKEKIYGMGHAVYKTYDPRATILKKLLENLSAKTGQSELYDLCAFVEDIAVKVLSEKGKDKIKPNIDFYSGTVYKMMGFSHDLFTPLFAVSRIAGWCAHIIEERFGLAQEKPALYRPAAEYVGNYCGMMGCEYKPKST
ncbi:MAG: citrate synthase [Nitrospiraceae bacterium]|nr:MAG: citrate synthase [Nitrospiraceae bacterium]